MGLDFERKQVVVDGLLLNYYFYIPENKPERSLIFLHGWRSESSVWFKLLENGRYNEFNIYLLDLPGYGKSQTPKVNFNLENYAEIVNKFIEKLNLQKPSVIGHSFGGAVLIKLASLDENSIDKLILIGASGIRNKKLKKSIIKSIAKAISPLFRPKFMQDMRINLYRMIGSDDYVATPHLKEIYLNVIKEDLTEDLKKIRNKTLLIWGEKDKDTPLRDGLLMKKNIKNSRLNIIKSAGHFSFITDSDLVSDYIINFINQNV